MTASSYDKGNWFHSRSSSSEDERDKIISLVNSSHSAKFDNLRWSGSTSDPNVISFAKEIFVDPSTMQTKIRQFIRLGYLKDDPFIPLKWSTLAQYWMMLSESGASLKKYADPFEQLIITYGLALYAFDSKEFSSNPTRGYRPLLALLQEVNSTGHISRADFENLVGERNTTYWRLDLIRGGILEETANGFKLTRNFPDLINAVQKVPLPSNLNDADWIEIRGDALDPRNPYRDAIISEIGKLLEDTLTIEAILTEDQKDVLSTVVSATDSKEQKEIDVGDYRVSDSYSRAKTRRKQSAWSKIVCSNYNYQCCMPACDVNGPDLISAAHIKRYSATETGTGHRANPENGLCFCPLCHTLFDKGYFTLTQDLRIEVSPQIQCLKSKIIESVLKNSDGKKIARPTKYVPSAEFIDYHRREVFKG